MKLHHLFSHHAQLTLLARSSTEMIVIFKPSNISTASKADLVMTSKEVSYMDTIVTADVCIQL